MAGNSKAKRASVFNKEKVKDDLQKLLNIHREEEERKMKGMSEEMKVKKRSQKSP
jgi:hypothetical protein